MRPLLAAFALLLLSCGSRPPPAEPVDSVAPEPEPAPPAELRSPATSCERPPAPVQPATADICDPANPTAAACAQAQPPPPPPDAFARIVDAVSEEGRTRIVLNMGLDDAVGPGMRGSLEVDGVEECFEIVAASRKTSTAYLRAAREQVMRTSLRVEIWQP